MCLEQRKRTFCKINYKTHWVFSPSCVGLCFISNEAWSVLKTFIFWWKLSLYACDRIYHHYDLCLKLSENPFSIFEFKLASLSLHEATEFSVQYLFLDNMLASSFTGSIVLGVWYFNDWINLNSIMETKYFSNWAGKYLVTRVLANWKGWRDGSFFPSGTAYFLETSSIWSF